MRESSEEYAASHGMGLPVSTSVDVYYDGALLVAGIPITSGNIVDDETQAVDRDCTLSVPRVVSLDEGVTDTDLLPTDALDPLECNGQQLVFQHDVVLPSGRVESFNLGYARTQSWADSDGVVDLTASGLLIEAQEDRLLRATQIPRGSSFTAALDRMIGDIIPFSIDDALPDRTTGAFTFEEDRLDGVGKLLDAWPARAYVDDQGVLQITIPYDDATDPVVRTVRDGVDGTLIKAPVGNDREGRYNAVVATGEGADDRAPAIGIAYLESGPLRWNGPFGNVAYTMASPLLTTDAQCEAAAETRLQNLQRETRPRTLTMIPDARLENGDIIRVESEDVPALLMRIQSIDFPTTYDGDMVVRGGVLTGRDL